MWRFSVESRVVVLELRKSNTQFSEERDRERLRENWKEAEGGPREASGGDEPKPTKIFWGRKSN